VQDNILNSKLNNSLKPGTFPFVWKTVHISPIYKNDDRSSILNYRPTRIKNVNYSENI